MIRTGNTSYVVRRDVLAVCSCGQQFIYAEDLNGHGIDNPTVHRWLYVKDVIVCISRREMRQWIRESSAKRRGKRSKRG